MRKYKKMNKVLALILFLSFTFAQPLAVLAETLSAEAPAPVIAIEKTETTQVAEIPIVSAEEKVETKTIPDSNNPVTQNPIPTQTVVPVSVSTAIVDPTSASSTVSETSSSSVEAREDEAVKTTETINSEEAATEEEELAPLDLGDNKTELDAKKDLTAIIRQSKDYYCGPAALATLMTQLGEDVSELQVVENIPINELIKDKGTNLLALKNAAKKLEQTVFLKKWNAEQVLNYIQETGDPVLIHDEKKDVGGHFSVIKSYAPENKTINEEGKEITTLAQVEISDTEAGNIKYSVEDFKHIYTGHVLIISSDKENAELNDKKTDISDEEAATIWGMYVPVYMLAYSSGDKEANDAANAYVLCTNKAMQIVNKEQRNAERAKCYQKLGTGVGDGLNAKPMKKSPAEEQFSMDNLF